MSEIFSMPAFWIILGLIAVMHVIPVFIKKAGFWASAANVILHIVLIAFLLINSAEPKVLFLSLLISTAIGLFVTRPHGKEDNGGI